MLDSQFLERFLDGTYTPGEHVLISPADPCDGFQIVLPFPFESVGKHIVERNCGILPVALGVVVELGFALR